MSPSIRISSPADILGFIPHALGFAPAASFVFLTLQGKRIGATLRVDAPAGIAPLDFARKMVTYLAVDKEATEVLLAVYADTETGPGDPLPFYDHVEVIIQELELANMPLREAWIVTPTHWRNLLCDEECAECLPHPLETITASIGNAAMIFRGSTVRSSGPTFAPFTGPADMEAKILAAVPSGRPPGTDAHAAGLDRVLSGQLHRGHRVI